MLLESGAEIDYQDAKLRSTPLMRASANGHLEVGKFLLENGALVDVRGNQGESALYLAIAADKVELVKLLLAHNAATDRDNIYGKTPIQKAKEMGNEEIIKLLSN